MYVCFVKKITNSTAKSSICNRVFSVFLNRYICTRDMVSESDLIEKEIEIYTCGKLYEKWRRGKRYWKVPESDLNFKVKYIDTRHCFKDSFKATVVSLHGSPGNYKEFLPVIWHLYKQGVRVIFFNFPGIDNLQPAKFRHTPEEKAEFLRDFLRALHVSSVDLLLCHSSALFPGIHLCLESKGISMKSMALVNPTGLDIPRLLTPVWFFKFLVKLGEHPTGYKLTELIGRRIINRPELMGGSVKEHYFSALTLLNSSIPEHAVPFKNLLNQNFPVLMAFSLNDKLISKRTSYNMAKMMIDPKDIILYDKDGKAQGSGGNDPLRKVMVFENGSHLLFKTYPDIISEAISSFLLHQVNSKSK